MKISNSKKQLAEIIHENGGWRDGAHWMSQDRDGGVYSFAGGKPVRHKDMWCLRSSSEKIGWKFAHAGAIKNWHQTILSRDEYLHLYPAPDADGWIEWKGGECPVAIGTPIAVRHRDGEVFEKTFALGDCWHSRWAHEGTARDVVAYRLRHPAAEPSLEPAYEAKPTIEQLAADYRNAQDYADRKQQEADAAKADAEGKLSTLVAAGKALGLVLGVATTEPELVITDWRDLQVGDRIWVGDSAYDNNCPAGEYDIADRDRGDDDQPVGVMWHGLVQWPQIHERGWRFIRRP